MITFSNVIGSKVCETPTGNSITLDQLLLVVRQQGFKTFLLSSADSEPEEKCSDIVFFVDNNNVILYWLYG